MRLDPKKKRLLMISGLLLVALLLLVVFVKSPIFSGVRDTITGAVISTGSEGGEEGKGEAESKAETIKTIKISSNVYAEDFQVPIDKLDITIEAEEVDLIMPSADITLTLEEPMVFEAFTGTINWRNSMFTLEGQLSKYLTDLIEINWKTAEDIKIRVKQGKVSISQINIASFGAVVTGEIKLADKVTLNPNKDLVTLENFRGSLTSEVEDMQTKLVLDGTIDRIFFGSQEFDLNIN